MQMVCDGVGTPTVLLVSGKGNGADTWSTNISDPRNPEATVFRQAARFTRVCAYDRHDAITAFAFGGYVFPRGAHPQIRIAINRDSDSGIGHRQHGLTEGGKARGKSRIADAGPVLGIQLIEVDCETLPEVPTTTDRDDRSAMRSVAATSQRGPAGSCERWPEHDRRPPIDGHACTRKRQDG